MYQKNMHQNQLYLEKGICHREIFTFSKLRIFHRLRDAQWKPTSPLQRLLGQCERRYGQGCSKGNKCSDGSIEVKLPAILGNSPNIRHRTNVRHLIIMFASLFPFFLLPVSLFPHFFFLSFSSHFGFLFSCALGFHLRSFKLQTNIAGFSVFCEKQHQLCFLSHFKQKETLEFRMSRASIMQIIIGSETSL